MAMRFLAIVMLGILATFALPTGVSATQAIPSSVWDTCSRYPTIEVSASGTTVTFAAKDDPRKLCAIFITPSGNVADGFAAAIANLKFALGRWGCWEVELLYRGGPAVVARCDNGGSLKEFSVAYQDGILFGFNISW